MCGAAHAAPHPLSTFLFSLSEYAGSSDLVNSWLRPGFLLHFGKDFAGPAGIKAGVIGSARGPLRLALAGKLTRLHQQAAASSRLGWLGDSSTAAARSPPSVT